MLVFVRNVVVFNVFLNSKSHSMLSDQSIIKEAQHLRNDTNPFFKQ